jgi:hypothetical protein
MYHYHRWPNEKVIQHLCDLPDDTHQKPMQSDALIQPYSGHTSRQSLEVYSKLEITEAQDKYDRVITSFPI